MRKNYRTREDYDHNIEGFALLCGGREDITGQDLGRINTEVGGTLTNEMIAGMIDEFDRDQDGSVGLEEFLYLMNEPTYIDSNAHMLEEHSKIKYEEKPRAGQVRHIDSSHSTSLLKAMTHNGE